MAGSQCLFTLAENSGLPLAMAVVWGVAACVGPLCLADRVLKGYLFGSPSSCHQGFGLLTWSKECVAARLGT